MRAKKNKKKEEYSFVEKAKGCHNKDPHAYIEYHIDANNNRAFCINRTCLETAEKLARKRILAQFTIENVFNSNRFQGKKGTWKQ